MDKKTKIMTLLAVLLVVIVGTILIQNSRPDSTRKSSKPASSQTSTATTNPSTTPAENGNSVTIKDDSFGPKNIIIKEGTTVTWTNQDSARHTVTADTASADAPKSELFGKGETYSFTFKTAGTYNYHCEVHPNMKGTITVTKETRNF
jgi:plastocyanin